MSIETSRLFTLLADRKRVLIALKQFVSVDHTYHLSINRKNSLADLKVFHSTVIRAPDFGTRGPDVDSRTLHFPKKKTDLFLVLAFYFPQFWSTTVLEYILKEQQHRNCNEKRSEVVFFFKMANTPHKGKIRHSAWLSKFLFHILVQCFYQDVI